MKSSSKFLIAIIFLSATLIVFSAEVLSQLSTSSTNYKLSRWTINPAGENMTSTNYILHAKIGQPFTNTTSSTNYVISWGWFDVIDLPNLFITFSTLNSTTPWYEDMMNATGRVYEIDGDPVVGAAVTVIAGDGRSSCVGLTDENGYWTCNISAPGQLGKFTAASQVREDDGTIRQDTIDYEVVIKYGEEPTGTVARYVYETPVFIQEPSGNVRIVTVRVIIWKSGR